MSFVREIVESNAMVTIDKITNEMPGILEDSLKLKETTLNYIEAVYVKFTCRPRTVHYFSETQKLLDRANTLEATLQEVIKVEVYTTKREITQCNEQLQQIRNNLIVCYEFNRHNEQLRQAQSHIEKQAYLNAAEILNSFRNVESVKYNILMQKIQVQASLVQGRFILELENIIKDHFQYTLTESDNSCTYSLSVKAKNHKVQQAILAIAALDMHNFSFLSKLKQMIWKVLNGIVQNASQVEINASECTINTKPKHKDNHTTVFCNLGEFAAFLAQHLCYQMNAELTIMEFLRNDIEEDLASLIVKDCLENTIPDSEEGLTAYHEVEKVTSVLQTKLIEAGLLHSDNTHIVDYASEVKVHFVNKKCDEFTSAAVALMKKDLHSTVIVGEAYDPNDLAFIGFPQCAISKSVPELLELITKMLQKEVVSPGGSSGYYVVSAKNILCKYERVVLEQHQRLLQTIPQQKAIFYNNCKYIAHALSTPQWLALHKQLPAALQEFDGFTLVAQHLSDYAVQMLDGMVQEQVTNIKERIDASGINLACDKLEPTAEKAVRQCLRQQELLKTVWQKILNYYDYNRTMGVLLDALSKAMAANIVKISDIPADVCDQLVDILKLIATRGPKLFSEPKEINMYVEHWGKLNEVMFVLNSSLALIAERWADGKGPLALHFSPDEMRKLIRALFQNSDARAALLSVI